MRDDGLGRVLVWAQLQELRAALCEAMAVPEVRGAARRVLVELTSADWARIGTIVGILWYKLDRLAELLRGRK